MTESAPFPEKQSVVTWLFNPFHYVAGGMALAVGLPIVIVASLNGALSNSHFDGVLDFHSGMGAPWWLYAAEGLLNWVIAGTVLFGAGLLISKSRVRAIDVFGTQALARVPTLAMAVMGMAPQMRSVPELLLANRPVPSGDVAVFAAISIGFLVMLIWMVILMYRGFATSCNVSGGKAIGTFTAGLLGAEIVSKIALIAVLYPFAL